MRIDKLSAILSVLLFYGATLQAAPDQWLHVRVEESGKKGETVRVNVPLDLAETLIPMIKDKQLAKGRLRIEEIKAADLKKIWERLRAKGDAEYVRIDWEDTKLRVFIEGNSFMVQSDEGSKDQIEVKVPLQVVDALFSGEENELNLLGAIRALGESGVRDLISIKSEDSTVEVWIDDKNDSN